MTRHDRVAGLTPDFADRAIRGVLVAMGSVATCTGIAVALRGTAAIPGGARTVPSNDSVLRFYAVWWAAQGPAMWSLARDPSLDENDLRRACTTIFMGGVARLASMNAIGRPHLLFEVLTVTELLLPPALLVLRRRVNDAAPDAPTTVKVGPG